MKRMFVFLFLFFTTTILQAATLKGTVTDAETGAPLSNINIRVQGQNLGVVTDNKGQYTIANLSPNTYILHLTHIGYTPQKIQISLQQDQQHNNQPARQQSMIR